MDILRAAQASWKLNIDNCQEVKHLVAVANEKVVEIFDVVGCRNHPEDNSRVQFGLIESSNSTKKAIMKKINKEGIGLKCWTTKYF